MIALLIPSFHGGEKLLKATRSVLNQPAAFDHIFISLNGENSPDLPLLLGEGLGRESKVTIFQTQQDLSSHLHFAHCVKKMAPRLGHRDYLFVLCHDDLWMKNTDWEWVHTEMKKNVCQAYFPRWNLTQGNDHAEGLKERTFFEGIQSPEEAIFSSIDQEGTYTNLSGIGVPFSVWKDFADWCWIKKSAARTELMLASHRAISNLIHVPGLGIQVEVSLHSDGASLSQKQIAWDEIIFYAWLARQGRIRRWQNQRTSARKIWANLKYLAKLRFPRIYRSFSLKKKRP